MQKALARIENNDLKLDDATKIFKTLITMLKTNGALTAQNVTDLKVLGKTLNIT